MSEWSTDGAIWSSRIEALRYGGTNHNVISPAIVRLAAGVWVMFTHLYRYTAPSPEGPWADRTSLSWSGSRTNVWHLDVIWTGSHYWALVDPDGGREPLLPATSRDGLTWLVGSTPMLRPNRSSPAWDGMEYYRGGLQLHPEGDKVRVWYSARPTEADHVEISWRIGYTVVPATYWTSLGG